MAIESVIELKIEGIDQLDDLERRLAALNNLSIQLSGGGGGSIGGSTGGTTIQGGTYSNVTINEYNTNVQRQSRNDIHAFSRGLQAASSTLGGLTTGFMKLSKAILGTGGLLSGVTSMATIAGMLKTAQNINQAAFMTNAIGVNPNDLSRLKATYGQVFNVESVYTQIAKERAAPYSMLMTQMGISQQQAQSMAPEELLMLTHQHARRMAQRYGANELALKAGGLEGTMTVEDLMRELNLSPGQLREIQESSTAYKGRLQLQQPEDWQRFNRMMSLGTQNVGTQMQNLLRPLLDPLFNVFNDFFNLVFGSDKQKMWEGAVESVRKGLVSLSEFIKTGDWESLWDKIKTALEKPLTKFTDYIESNFMPALMKLENGFNTLGNWADMIGNAFKGVYDFLIEKGLILPKQEATDLLSKSDEQFNAAFSRAEAPIVEREFRRAAKQEIMRRNLPPEMEEFLVAQAKQETANFGSVSSWNFGNITGEYQGRYKVRGDKDAQGRPIRQKFRAYQSADESVMDMLDLLKRRYPSAYGAHSIEEYSEGLRGWAADPQYAAHVRERFKKTTASPMTGNVSRPVYGNTRVDVNVNAPASADTTVQTSRTPGAPNTASR